MLEVKIEDTVCDYALHRGFKHWKFATPNRRGNPDRLYLKQALWFTIEFKKRGEKLDPLQVVEVDDIREHGGLVYVIDNIGDGTALIRAVDSYLLGLGPLPAEGAFPSH